VTVCATGVPEVADLPVAVAPVAVAPVAVALVAVTDAPVAVAIWLAVCDAGCTTALGLLLASSMLPPTVKKDATLRPARSTRVAAAGWRRRVRGRAPVGACGVTTS
jgi:hypothetical protein